MTNYNERLDEIIDQLSDSSASRGWLDCKSGSEDTHPRNDLVDIAKQAITSLIKELVAEAKPLLKEKIASIEFIIWDRKTKVVGTFESETDLGFNKVINEFEQNLLKALGNNGKAE